MTTESKKNVRNSLREDGTIDWEDVERKVQIISRRFSTTIDWKYREDLEQELRLFAWTTSSNYYDMYRRAVDYWRMLTRRVFPEVCVFEFDDNNGQGGITEDEYNEDDEFTRMISKIREAVDEYQTTKHERTDHDNCMKILDLIEEIESGTVKEEPQYTKGKLKLEWVSQYSDIKYNRVQDAFWLLQNVIATLEHLGRIEVPSCYKTVYKPF